MADLNIALILKLVDRATGPARAAMRAIERMGGDGLMRQAQRAQAASAMIAGGVGSIAGTATRGGLALAAYGAGIGALAASFVRPAAQFEQFNVQLTTLEGSSEKAASAMSWIETFATKTPLSVEQTVQAYAKLKAFGLDPTTGSLQAMVDTMAATGGGAEKLDGLTLALGQAWSKGKLQGEEAMQMLERGVPVWDLLSQQMGMTTAEVQKLSEQGKLGREEITLLMDALGSKYSGASERASETWDGIISNIGDQWTRFQRLVMATGVFDWMKGQLEDLLDTLDTMSANGELQVWAESTGKAILNGLIGIKDFGKGIYDTLNTIQAAIGGWDVLAWSTLALTFSKTLWAVAAGFTAIGKGLLLLSANPLVLIAAAAGAVALSVYAIYDQWDRIGAFFNQKFADIAAAFDSSMWEGWLKVLTEFNPGTLLIEFLVGLPVLIGNVFGIDLYGAGMKMIESFLNGIKAKMGEVAAFVTGAVSAMFPGYQAGGLAALVAPDAPQNRDYPYGSNFTEAGRIRPGALPPGRELGGPVRAGQIYEWQEKGREMFVPRTDGSVISNRQLRGMAGSGRGGGGAAPSFRIGEINIIAAPGQSAREVALAVRRELQEMARTAPLHDGGSYGD